MAKAKKSKGKGVTIAKNKTIKLTSAPSVEAGREGNVSAVKSNLNIVLGRDEINSILRSVVGEKGQNAGTIFNPGGNVAINGGGCCVDASVGSSVIGPVSSVGSSVSVVGNVANVAAAGRADRMQKIQTQLGGSDVKLTLPAGTKIT